MNIKSLIGFLVLCIVIIVAIYGVNIVLPMLGLPGPINTLVLLIVGLVCLLGLLNYFGLVGGGPWIKSE